MGICDVFPDVDAAGQHCVSVYARPLPPAFSLIVGDCVNCLRSSLDHVATQIVSEITQKTGRFHFPMHEARDNLVDMTQKSPIKEAFPNIENIILNTINPCKAGNETLWLTGKLSNIDKHRQIIVTAGVTSVHIERIFDDNHNQILNSTVEVKNGTGNSPFGNYLPFKIDGKITPTVSILFGPVENLIDRPVLPLLVEMLQRTGNAINAIETEYLR